MSDDWGTESPVDIDSTAKNLHVAADALAGVINHYEQRGRRALEAASVHGDAPLIADVLAYQHAIAVVELTDRISHADEEGTEYALVDFNGYVIPFHATDERHIPDLTGRAGLTDTATDDSNSDDAVEVDG